MKDTIFLFPDTNVFLHFPPIHEIDWCAICDAKAVQLIVCLTVIHELDAKKNDPRLADRAERAIKEIRDAQKSGIELRSGVTIKVFNREIRASDFPDTLSPDSADDRIVHLAKVFRDENPIGEVAIATGDYGMELRAEAGSIATVPFDKSSRLPNPQDELTRKYKQAVNELHAMKNRQPKMSILLSHPDSEMAAPHEVHFDLDDSWQPRDIDTEVQLFRNKYPQQAISHLHGLHPHLPSRESIERYNSKLDNFYDKCRRHLEEMNVIGEVKARSFCFDLWLINDGNGLATDIDVVVNFPPVVRFVAEKGTEDAEPLEKGFPAPEPPEFPNPLDFASLRSPILVKSRIPAIPNRVFTGRDEWKPDAVVFRKDDHTNEIHVIIGKLKHGHSVCLGNFVIVFASWDAIKPFHAEFTISTSELTDKIEGKVPFIARLKVASTSPPASRPD